jgi:hypothetical protein
MDFLLFILLVVTSPAQQQGEDVFLFPIDAAPAIEKAETWHSAFDIGRIEDAFDGDPHSLVRTKAVNPLEIRIRFQAPIRTHGVRLVFSRDVHEVRLHAAQDACGKPEILCQGRTGSDGVFRRILGSPVDSAEWILNVRRITGDDYVHLYEWEFLEPGPPGALRITCVEEGPGLTARTGLKSDPLPEDLAHPCTIWLRAVLDRPGGQVRDVTAECTWKAARDGVLEPMEKPGSFASLSSGGTRVTAEGFGAQAEYAVRIEERRMENRAPDLDVGFIERFPKIEFDAPEGWPADNDEVRFRATVIWWGGEPIEAVDYRWTLDGRVSGQGVIESIAPLGGRARVELPWRWKSGRHTVGFEIDPENKVEELTRDNNRVIDFTDALTVGFWVDRQVYDRVHEHRHRLVGEGNSFEDWAQHLIRRWNKMFEAAVFPMAPEGVLDRVRLDKVVVVPTDALPLNGGIPTNNPDTRDRTVDLMWGFPARDLRNGAWTLDPDGWMKEDLGVLHELGHARYLVDAYGFDVHASGINILDEQGEPVAGGPLMPGEICHHRKYAGQMGGRYDRLSEYDACCWNLKAGQRAKGSACNAPPDIGSFLQLMPERSVFLFQDSEGAPLAGATLRVHQAQGNGKDWYAKIYDHLPDLEATLGPDGGAEFGRDLFGGPIVHGFGHSNAVVIFEVLHQGRAAYLFQEVTDLNLACMRGEREHARFVRTVRFP